MIGRIRDRFWQRGSTARSLAIAAFWSLKLRIFGVGLGFVVGVLLARMLGPAELGIYGVVLGIAMILMSLAQVGLPTLAVRELVRHRSSGEWGALRGMLRWSGLVAAGVGSLLGAGLLAVLLLLDSVDQRFFGAALWAAPLIPVMALTILLNAELRAFDWLVKGQSLEIVLRPAGMALLLLLVWAAGRGLSPASAMAINLGASTVAMLAGLYWIRRVLPAEARSATPITHRRQWLTAAAPLAASETLRQVDAAYGVLVMGIVASAADTGIFRVAMSCVAIVAMPLSIFQVVLAPTLARLHFERKHSQLQQLCAVAALAMLGATIAATLLVFMGGQWLMILLFGADYAGAWLPLVVLGIAQSAGALFGVASVLLGVAEGERDQARAYAAAILVSVAAAVPLADRFGSVGAAAASVLTLCIYQGLSSLFVWRRLRIDTTPLALLRPAGRLA